MNKVSDILNSPKVQPLAIGKAREKINALARDSKNVVFTEHSIERMSERDISSIDVYRILKEGVIRNEPEKRDGKPLWTYKVEYINFSGNRDKYCIVAIKGNKLFLITAY